jgi:hypothetical protein
MDQNEKPLLEMLSVKELIALEREEMDPDQIEDRAKVAADLWERYFEKVVKVLTMNEALEVKKINVNLPSAESAAMQLMWIKGVLAGFDIIKLWFEDQVNVASGRGGDNNLEQ